MGTVGKMMVGETVVSIYYIIEDYFHLETLAQYFQIKMQIGKQ